MSLESVLFMLFLLNFSTATTITQKQERNILDLQVFQETSSDAELLSHQNSQLSEADILEKPPIYESYPYVKAQPDSQDTSEFQQSSYLFQTKDKRDSSTVQAQFRSNRPGIREEVKEFLKEFLEKRKSKSIPKPQEPRKSVEKEESKKCLQRNSQGALVFDVCKDEDFQEPDFVPVKPPAKQPKHFISVDSGPDQDEFPDSNEDKETFSTPAFEESVEKSEHFTQEEQEQDSLAEEAEISSQAPEQSSQSEDSSAVIEKKATKKKKKAKKPKNHLGSLAQTLDLVRLLSLQNTIKSVENPALIPKVVIPVSEEPENCLKLWSEWSPTTDCSKKCGGCAQQSFRRKCLSAPKCPCDGITFKAEICNLQPCRPPQTPCCDNLSPVLTATGDYICGKSDDNPTVIFQPQAVVQPAQPQVLELQPATTNNVVSPKTVAVEEPQLEEACCADPRGTWSSWRAADQCNKECGGFGRQNRKRLCLSTPHGCPCIGNTDEVVACNLRPCPFSAKTPSSCAPGLSIQFRNNNPLCISLPASQFQSPQQSPFNANRDQLNQQQRNQIQPNTQRFQPSNARQSFGEPNFQFDGGPVQVRKEVNEDEENYQVDSGDDIPKDKSVSQEVIKLNESDKQIDVSFADNNLFEEDLDKLAERIENGEVKPDLDDESKSEEHLTFPVDIQYSNTGVHLPEIRKNNQGLQNTTDEKTGSSHEPIPQNSTDLPYLSGASSTSKPPSQEQLIRSKRQVQQPSPIQTPATSRNQLDYQRFLQQQASGKNSLLTNQPATLGSTISYSDLFGYQSNSVNSNIQASTKQLLAGNTYPFTSPIASQTSLGPGPLQIQANLPGIQTPNAATEDRTGQAALVGIHPGVLEWREDQARAAAGRLTAAAIPVVATAASSSGLQRAGVDSGSSSPASATQSSSYFLGINNQGRSFNQRNGRVLSIIPGYLVVQSSSADVAARLLSQLKPNRLGLGSKNTRLSVIYPALRPQETTNEKSVATVNGAASAVAQALANQAALLNAAGTNSNTGPAALELTQPSSSGQGSSQDNQVLVGTGQVVNNQDNGFGGINPINVGGFAGFYTGDSVNIQQGQEEAPVYFEGQARNLAEEEPVIGYSPAVPAYKKIKEDEVLEKDNGQKDETGGAILAEDGVNFGEELVGKDEFDRKMSISNQFEGMNADVEILKKMFDVEEPLEKEIVQSSPNPLHQLKEQYEKAEDSVFNDSSPNILSNRVKRQNAPNQQALLTSLQRQLLQNGANGQAGYQNQVRQPNPVANLLAMRRLQQQYLQKLLRDRLARLQQSQNPNTQNNNDQGQTFGGTALQQGEANVPPGLVPNQAGSIQSPAQPASGPPESSSFNLSNFNLTNLAALLGFANLSESTPRGSTANLESEKNKPAPAYLANQVGLNTTSSSDQRLAEAIAQSRAADQAVPRPITEQQPSQQDEVPPLLPSGQIQTPANTFAGTSRTQPGVMDDRHSSVYSSFGQVNGTALAVPPINAATQSGSQLAGSKPPASGPNSTLQAIRQQQQTAILAAIFARTANLGNTGGVAPVESPLPNGPLQPKFQPQGTPSAQQTSISSSPSAGGYAVPPGLAGVPTSPSAQKSAASSQGQSLSQQLKAFLAAQKSQNPVQSPKSVVQPVSPPNQQSLSSQTAVLQQQLVSALLAQQQLNRQSNTQQQLQQLLKVLNGNLPSIQPPAQPAILTIQPQIQSQKTPASNLQIQSLLPQDGKGSIPLGYAIVQQPIYVIQQPAVSQPVSNQGVVRVNANNLRQQLLQSQRLQQLQKIQQQQQQQSRNSLQSIYVNSGGSSGANTKSVASRNYYMSGIGFDLSTASDRTRPSTRLNQGNIGVQNIGQGNGAQHRIEQPQRPIQIQQSRQSSLSYQQNRGSLISSPQSQFTRQPNCCVLGGIWDLWSEWSGCGTGCGGCGIRKRTRLCASASQGCPCSNEQMLSSQTEICNRNPCSFPDQACCGQLKPKLSGNNYICA